MSLTLNQRTCSLAMMAFVSKYAKENEKLQMGDDLMAIIHMVMKACEQDLMQRHANG